jgi:hypothetical protein
LWSCCPWPEVGLGVGGAEVGGLAAG